MLDQTWSPVAKVPMRRALGLLFSGLDGEILSSRPSAERRAQWLRLQDLTTHDWSSTWAVSKEQSPQHNFIRTPSVAVRAPAVIVLANSTVTVFPNRSRTRAVPFSRLAVLRRDSFRCAYCGSVAETIDHVVPRVRGGTSSYSNCAACCKRCNSTKGSKTLEASGLQLRLDVRLEAPDFQSSSRTKRMELHRQWLDLLERHGHGTGS